MTPTFLTLPAPPSVNTLFRNVPGRGRVKTAAYKDWISQCNWMVRSQKPAPVPGHVIVVIGVERTSEMADIDNLSKAILDRLVGCKLIDDDRFVTAFAMAWAQKGERMARIAIMPAADLTLDLHLAEDGKSGGWFIQAPQGLI